MAASVVVLFVRCSCLRTQKTSASFEGEVFLFLSELHYCRGRYCRDHGKTVIQSPSRQQSPKWVKFQLFALFLLRLWAAFGRHIPQNTKGY